MGTTRSRINFFMNKFRKLGFIEYDGGSGELKVHSALLNVVVHYSDGFRSTRIYGYRPRHLAKS